MTLLLHCPELIQRRYIDGCNVTADKSPWSIALINSLQRRQLKIINWIRELANAGWVHPRVRGGSGRMSGRRRGSRVAAPGAASETLFVAAASARSSWTRSASRIPIRSFPLSSDSILSGNTVCAPMSARRAWRGKRGWGTASRLVCESSKRKLPQIDRILPDAGDNFYPVTLPLTLRSRKFHASAPRLFRLCATFAVFSARLCEHIGNLLQRTVRRTADSMLVAQAFDL